MTDGLTIALMEAYHITAYRSKLSYFLQKDDIVYLNSIKLTKELYIDRNIIDHGKKAARSTLRRPSHWALLLSHLTGPSGLGASPVIGCYEHIEGELEYRLIKLAKMHGAHGLADGIDPPGSVR